LHKRAGEHDAADQAKERPGDSEGHRGAHEELLNEGDVETRVASGGAGIERRPSRPAGAPPLRLAPVRRAARSEASGATPILDAPHALVVVHLDAHPAQLIAQLVGPRILAHRPCAHTQHD